MVNTDSMFYSEEYEVVGKLVSADFIKGTYQIMDIYGNMYTVDTSKLTELEQLGTLGDHVVFNHDVLLNNDSNTLFEIVKFEDGFKFHHLNEDLERTGNVGNKGFEEHFTLVENCMEILGNIFEMKKELKEKKSEEMDFNFNIAIYKADVGGSTTYFYAGNNKKYATVDLIKVIYMGHHLLEEEEYELNVYTYEQFQSLVNTGVIVESTPMELSNFVMGKIASASYTPNYSSASPASYEEEDFIFDEYDDMPYDEDDNDEEEVKETEDCDCDVCCPDEEEEKEEKEHVLSEEEEKFQQELMEAVGQLVFEVMNVVVNSADTKHESDTEEAPEPTPEPKSTTKDSDDVYLWD